MEEASTLGGDQVNYDRLKLEFCRIKMQLADMLIKPLKKARLDDFKKLIGIETFKQELGGVFCSSYVLKVYN